MAATPRVTLTLTHTRPGHVGSTRVRREIALHTYRVDVDGRRAGEVEAYVASVDLTPYARTRRDGAPRKFWFGRPDGGRSSKRDPKRADAIETVLIHALPTWGYDAIVRLAATATVTRSTTEEK